MGRLKVRDEEKRKLLRLYVTDNERKHVEGFLRDIRSSSLSSVTYEIERKENATRDE